MFRDFNCLRDGLLAARFLREEILGHCVLPSQAARLAEGFLADNAAPGGRGAIERAVLRGRQPDLVVVDRAALTEIATAAGSGDLRTHAGTPFQGKPAPGPARVEDLLSELLDTINAPVAVESWPPPVRAFGLHFLLRLVQPFQAPADVVGHAAEAMLLAADGFAADRMLVPEPGAGVVHTAGKPDPDAFAAARTDRLVERLGESRDRVRDAAARSLLSTWAGRREARLTPRQARLVKWLADGDPDGRITFQEYVDLHAGRRAPSLRSLQRDFQRLRERGLLRADGEAFALDARPLEWGRTGAARDQPAAARASPRLA